MTSIADEIEKLDALRKNGAISEEEYQQAKNSLLERNAPVVERLSKVVDEFASNENTWGMIIHFSQLLFFFAPVGLFIPIIFIFPIVSIVLPIILWQMKKDRSHVIDLHGRIVINWILTAIIAGVIFKILCLVLIGFPLLGLLVILCIIFPIIGGIKANRGEVWPYPFSIRFFKLSQ